MLPGLAVEIKFSFIVLILLFKFNCYSSTYDLLILQQRMLKSIYYHFEDVTPRRGPSPRFSAWATQFRGNVKPLTTVSDLIALGTPDIPHHCCVFYQYRLSGRFTVFVRKDKIKTNLSPCNLFFSCLTGRQLFPTSYCLLC